MKKPDDEPLDWDAPRKAWHMKKCGPFYPDWFRRCRRWIDASEEELTRETQRTQEGSAHPLMLALLEVAVPMYAERLAAMPFEQRQARAKEIAVLLSGTGSAALADSDVEAKPGVRAHLFNALAEGLAIGSLQPCGVTWGSAHWEFPRND